MEPVESMPVVNNKTESRFEIRLDDEVAFLAYTLRPGRHMQIDHTEVPDALQGKGLAGRLAQTALEYARAQNLRVIPLCPFVRTYLKRHPEYAGLISTSW
jgi:predicted GNAT family acetyltransferase